MSNENENINSTNDEDLDNDQLENIDENLENNGEEILDEIEDEDLKAKFSALQDKNKRLFERAKKAEGKFKKFKEEKPEDTPSAKPTPSKVGDISITAVLDLQAQGFSPIEIKDLNEEAKTMGVPIDTLISNTKYMAGVEASRDKDKVEQATPRPTSSNPIKLQGGKTFKGVIASEKSTKDDKQKAFEEQRDNILGK